MSRSEAPALTAVAFQFMGALERYQREVDAMLEHCDTSERYQAVAETMEQLRGYAAELPDLSVPWVEVLIRHFEITHGLWRVRQGKPDEMRAIRAAHAAAVESLVRRLRHTQLEH